MAEADEGEHVEEVHGAEDDDSEPDFGGELLDRLDDAVRAAAEPEGQ